MDNDIIKKDGLQTSGNESVLQSELVKKLLSSSDMVTSSEDFTDELSGIIQDVRQSYQSAGKAISSGFDRAIAQKTEAGELAIQGQLESRSGFATNMTALRTLTKTTDQSINDIEARKQEALLNNDATMYSKLADLQFNQIEFKTKAEQQTFANLLGLANFGLSQKESELAAKKQTFEEKKAISDIAVQFGVDVKPGDTIESITTKAYATGLVSDKQKAELDRIKAETRLVNEQINDIRRKGTEEGFKITDENVGVIYKALNSAQTEEERAKILRGLSYDDYIKVKDFGVKDTQNMMIADLSSDIGKVTKSQKLKEIEMAQGISPEDKLFMRNYVEKNWKEPNRKGLIDNPRDLLEKTALNMALSGVPGFQSTPGLLEKAIEKYLNPSK